MRARCKACVLTRIKEIHEADPRKRMLRCARLRAKAAGVPFELTIDDIEIPEVCPALGIPLVAGMGRNNPNGPSLDRTVPALGYVRGNVRVISHRANSLKNDATPEELAALAAYAAEATRQVLNESSSA